MVTPRRIVLALLAGALAGFAIFGVLVYRASSVQHVQRPEALRRFAAVRSAFGASDPLLTLDDEGRVIRRAEPSHEARQPLSRLGVLAYRAADGRLVAVDIPFWFFELKGPAAQYVVRGTGLDLERLEITAADLERHGPAVVIDQTRSDGGRLLVWTE